MASLWLPAVQGVAQPSWWGLCQQCHSAVVLALVDKAFVKVAFLVLVPLRAAAQKQTSPSTQSVLGTTWDGAVADAASELNQKLCLPLPNRVTQCNCGTENKKMKSLSEAIEQT